MKATQSGNFKAVMLPDPQTAVARCYSLIDIGTIPNIYKGQLQGIVRKIYVTWEFPGLKAIFNDDKGEEPFVIGQELTLSTSENSNLAKLISHWRNKPLTAEEQKGFDVAVMVNKTALISFVHNTKSKFKGQTITEVTNENTALKFNGILPKPKEMECPPMLNPKMVWDWDVIESKDQFNAEMFMKIPRWLRNKIMESDEFKKFGYDPDNQDSGSGSSAAPVEDNSPVAEEGDGW